MPASSESIAKIAGALAKAQIELVNPPKTLTAALERGRNGSGGQTYRYAPLSAGLDTIRKTLGKHDIAVIQATELDPERAMMVLTTTLAHASGEWIAARWPVCPTSDLSHPKLMGAALTYARRYSLFTLVGLAGEDDLDGPDLDGRETDLAERKGPNRTAEVIQHSLLPDALSNKLDSNEGGQPLPRAPGRSSRPLRKSRKPASAGQREDLAHVQDPDALFQWALNILPTRNRLDEGSRAALDSAFLAKADLLGADPEVLIPFASARTLPNAEPDPASPA